MSKWQKILALVVAAAAMAWCIRANTVTRYGDETGTPFDSDEFVYFSSRSRLRRANGWPKDVFVRLNWAKAENGRVVAIEGMHPKESDFDNYHFFINSAVTIAIGYSVYTLLLFLFQWQISLRSFIALMTCMALLAAFLGPYVKDQLEIRRADKLIEQAIQAQQGPFYSPPAR